MRLERVIEAEARAKRIIEAPLSVGTRVMVGAIQILRAVSSGYPGDPTLPEEPLTDGREGEGEIVALDHEYARVRYRDGREQAGVRLTRCRRAT
jgi:hypothetical protein